MNPDKLKALRSKYASAKGGDIFDPAFAAVAATVFVDADQRKWPFAGVATFLGAPMAAPSPSSGAGEFGDIDVALVGVPMDLGVTNRAGARLGPRAVRGVERIGPYEHVLKMAPLGMLKVADIGDVPMRSRFSLEQCMADIEAFFRRLRAANVIALAVGGDHSITYPILKALGERPTRRHGAHRCALRFRRRIRRIQVPPRRAVPPGGPRWRARSRALDPDRHPWRRLVPVGILVRIGNDGAACGRSGRDGHRGRRREGTRRRRRWSDLRHVRRRRHRPRLRARHRHAGSRWPHSA